MQWYESEDAAVEALESATEYLWGLDWDRHQIEITTLTRLNELEDGIALNPLNPYFIPEQEELPDEPDCGCREPGDICSEGMYVGRCECEEFEVCDVCAGTTSVEHKDECDCEGYDPHECECPCHSRDNEPVAADGSLTDLFCRFEHLYALALKNAERLDAIEESLKPKFNAPSWWRTPGGCSLELQKQAQGGTTQRNQPPWQQAYNRGTICGGGNNCRCGCH